MAPRIRFKLCLASWTAGWIASLIVMGEIGSHDATFRNDWLSELRPCYPDVFEFKFNLRSHGR
jgi:hypothetical protein